MDAPVNRTHALVSAFINTAAAKLQALLAKSKNTWRDPVIHAKPANCSPERLEGEKYADYVVRRAQLNAWSKQSTEPKPAAVFQTRVNVGNNMRRQQNKALGARQAKKARNGTSRIS